MCCWSAIASVLLIVGCSAGGRPEAADASAGGGGDGPDEVTQPDAPAGAAITVLTMNLKTPLPSDATLEQRTQIVANLILAEQPDVIALQEATESGSLQNRAEALAAMVGYAWVWRRTHQLGIGDEGIAILARGPIAWSDDAELPHTEFGVLHRAVLGARAMVDGQAIELYATHLSVAGDDGDRADQATEALAFARAHREPGTPAFLAGDLNAVPGELAMRVLRGEAAHDGVTGDLVDAWTAVHGGAPGYTIPSDGPDRRIDYIYALPGSGAPAACQTVLAAPVDGVRASDHLGVLCRFAVAPR